MQRFEVQERRKKSLFTGSDSGTVLWTRGSELSGYKRRRSGDLATNSKQGLGGYGRAAVRLETGDGEKTFGHGWSFSGSAFQSWCLGAFIGASREQARELEHQLFHLFWEPSCSSHPRRQTFYNFALTTSFNILAVQSLLQNLYVRASLLCENLDYLYSEGLISSSRPVQIYSTLWCYTTLFRVFAVFSMGWIKTTTWGNGLLYLLLHHIWSSLANYHARNLPLPSSSHTWAVVPFVSSFGLNVLSRVYCLVKCIWQVPRSWCWLISQLLVISFYPRIQTTKIMPLFFYRKSSAF
jgi:hypothetical protein